MIRIVVARYGGPDVLEPREEPLCEPRSGEARVRVEAAGVSFADLLVRQGLYPGGPRPPLTPGYDLIGRVDALGSGGEGEFARADAPSSRGPLPARPAGTDSAALVGSRVAALTVTRSYAQYVCLPARDLVPVPPSLDAGEAVCLVLNYLTAWQMLHREARVPGGGAILVHGAAGGVGTALLELGRLAGITRFGTVSRAKHAAIAHLGAELIDYRSEDFVSRVLERTKGAGVQAAFDPVGGANLRRSYRCLARGGRLVSYGATIMSRRGRLAGYRSGGASLARVAWLSLVPDGRRASFYSILHYRHRHPAWFREDLGHLFALLEQGRVRPIVAARLPLVEAARAHRMLEEGATIGKIVLLP